MKIAACVVVRNEERAIAEWIAFHLVVGFDTLIVFDNSSTDRTAEVARSMGIIYDVRVFPWPETGPAWQMSAYDEALTNFGAEFDWIAFIDSDEFLLPLGAQTIRVMLENAGDAAAVIVPWMMFGSSRHETRPPELVLEAYRWRSEDNFGPNLHVKSIVRPTEAVSALNPHCFTLKGQEPGDDARHVDPTGAPITWSPGSPGLLSSHAAPVGGRLNHYFVKSLADWQIKVTRGYHGVGFRTLEEFSAYDQNAVYDDSADPFLEHTKQTLRRANLSIFTEIAFE